ncbi:MAG: NAD-dependent dihydropyrimidine dehydrogenase subunit PreA, partial [Planctomycetota bacterium]|nr:NAD-dependent dihydropyrimidine dehydrogenase subunit PreA [Planctomycetota bacterium]
MRQCDSLLDIKFCGLEFTNPFILASGPPTRTGPMILKAFEYGWGGAVTKTIGLHPTKSPRPRLYILPKTKSLVNIELISSETPSQWVKWIATIKKQASNHIIIVSIMAGRKKENWQKLAKIMGDAGADALELNVSCPHGMPEKAMGLLIGQDPKLCATVTAAVKKVSTVPVIVKLTPNVTDITAIARACKESGADALSGINTVKALAGININTFSPLPSVKGRGTFGGYAGRSIKPIALRCIAEMYRATGLPISGCGGIFDWKDALEFLLIGARTLQICTAVMLSGYSIINPLKNGLRQYLIKHRFKSTEDLVGHALAGLVKHSSLITQTLQVRPDKCRDSLSEGKADIKQDFCLLAVSPSVSLGSHPS